MDNNQVDTLVRQAAEMADQLDKMKEEKKKFNKEINAEIKSMDARLRETLLKVSELLVAKDASNKKVDTGNE